jgi:sugar phosphate isomerase/epimerase
MKGGASSPTEQGRRIGYGNGYGYVYGQKTPRRMLMTPEDRAPLPALSRRTFLGAAAGMAAGGALRAASGEERARPDGEPAAPRRAGQPRIGCVSWCFHDFGAFAGRTIPEEAIDKMGEIGFEGTDLILTDRKDIEEHWTDARIGAIRDRLEKKKLALAQFVIFQPVVEGLSSLDRAERERNLDYFEAGVKIGKKLGAPVIDIVAPWARELRKPGGGYLPRHYDVPNARSGDKFRIEMDPSFDWDRIWSAYVETTRACLERVKAQGLALSIEHHTHCLIHDAGSFLRLWDAIRDPALGFNLDTGWTLSQREYPPVAIHKVKDRLMNVHARDIDGLMRSFVPVGEGVMDFGAIGAALKAIGYGGFVSIEQDKYPDMDMEATCKRYLAIMREALG